MFHLVGAKGAWIPSSYFSPFWLVLFRTVWPVVGLWWPEYEVERKGNCHCPPARWQTAESTGLGPLVMHLVYICGHIWSLLASITQPLMVSGVCVLSSSFFSSLVKVGICVNVWGDVREVKRDREIIDVAVLVPGNFRKHTYQGVSKLPVPLDTWKAQGSESLASSSFTKDSRTHRPVGQPGGQVTLG